MAVFKNCYHVLGIPDFSEVEVVKSAFRQLARRYHPDLNGGDAGAEEKFKEINAAYEMLSDPGKRAWHDRCLKAMSGGKTAKKARPGGAGAENSSAAKSASPAETKETVSPTGKTGAKKKAESATDEKPQAGTFSELFDGFLKKGFAAGNAAREESFKEVRKNAGNRSWEQTGGEKQPARRGEDVVVKTVISPLEAIEGVVKSVQVQHQETCRRCSGTGRVNGTPCTACHGDKIQIRIRKMDVRIPAGVKTGSKVRVAREGGRGSGGGENGDLFLQIEVAYDPSLRIDGLDVHSTVLLSVAEAVLGVEIEIPTLNGPVKITIPPGSQPGRVLRLKERGVQSGNSAGDHFVTLALELPQNLSPRERELYQELARLRPRPS